MNETAPDSVAEAKLDGRAARPEFQRLAEILEEELTGKILPPDPALSPLEHDRRLKGLIQHIHADETGRTALCLSGGGIRSASFALGVLQALARKGVLEKFDYLSTVSGGGYIGGWLSAWFKNNTRGRDGVIELLQKPPDDPTDPEWKPIRHLRSFSNYLTPKLGLFSADSWTLVATVFRNILLNWLVLISVFVLLLVLPRLLVAAVYAAMPAWVLTTLLTGGFLLAAVSLAYPVLDLPGEGNARWSESRFLRWRLIPLLAAAICFTGWWAGSTTAEVNGPGAGTPWIREGCSALRIIGFFWLLCVTAYLLTMLVEMAAPRIARPERGGWTKQLLSLLFSIVAATFAGLAVRFLAQHFPLPLRHAQGYVCLAPPALLGIYLLANYLLVGFSSFFSSDEDREWWGRSGGWLLLSIVGWISWTSLSLYPPDWLDLVANWFSQQAGFPEAVKNAVAGISGVVAIVGGLATALHGSGNRSTPTQTSSTQGKLALATMGFFVLLSVVIGYFLRSPKAIFADYWPSVWSLLWVCLGTIALPALMSCFVNVNKFSLHAMYRNRLIRAFLGASRTAKDDPSPPGKEEDAPVQRDLHARAIRSPHPFTGFDPLDNFPLHELPAGKPLHVINMALNLVGGEELAWQERKASSFTASRLHCGSWRLGYRPSEQYGGSQRSLAQAVPKPEHSISLGTAVAISGAAASPNMGYNSSPLVTLLMTIFNARLGWWLGNPGPAGVNTWRFAGPRFALRPLLAEATGGTTDTFPYIYLSDGGHFENLGIYEMVLRRNRFIVAVDAASDKDFHFEDLGNAIRKIRIDLGILIDIQVSTFHADADGTRLRCAYGRIEYWRVDSPNSQEDLKMVGHLLYLKPLVCGQEPADVANYANAHPEFPHESTADQFFSESQIESYRMLGSFTLETICAEKAGSVPEFFEAVTKNYLKVNGAHGLFRREALATAAQTPAMAL